MGMNRRDLYAELAWEGVKDSPLIGNGISAISSIISYYGFGNSSFHNYYLESAYINGIIYFFSIIVLIAFSYWKLFKFDSKNSALYLFLVIAANNFSYAIGGVGYLSVLLTVLNLSSSFDSQGCMK